MTKLEDDSILAACPECQVEDTLISNWQTTPWAKGHTAPWRSDGALDDDERVH